MIDNIKRILVITLSVFVAISLIYGMFVSPLVQTVLIFVGAVEILIVFVGCIRMIYERWY